MRRALLVLLLTAGVAAAHDVPVNPNTCTFDPLQIGDAVVAPPADADALRIVYTVATNLAQFQAGTVPPRAFTIAGVDGTIAFPTVFSTTLTTAGDLAFPSVPLAFVVGGAAVTVPIALTTGLADEGGVVVGGRPMGADGVVALAGVIPAGTLPPPLDGVTAVRLQCRLLPVGPDLDQFAEAAAVAKLGGYVKPAKGKLHAVLQVPIGAPIDFAKPALLRFTAGGADLLVLDLPSGLAGAGKKFSGTATDGSAVTIKAGKKKPRPSYKVQITTPGQTIAPPPGGQTDVQATFEVAGVLARGTRTFKAKSGGLRAP
jgi:hypothetical protein